MAPKSNGKKSGLTIEQKWQQRHDGMVGIAAVYVGDLPICKAEPTQYLDSLARLFDEPEGDELLARLHGGPAVRKHFVELLDPEKCPNPDWENAAHCGLQAFGFAADEARRWMDCEPDDKQFEELRAFVDQRCLLGGRDLTNQLKPSLEAMRVKEIFDAFIDWRREKAKRTGKPPQTKSFADNVREFARALHNHYNLRFDPAGSGSDPDPVLSGISVHAMEKEGAMMGVRKLTSEEEAPLPSRLTLTTPTEADIPHVLDNDPIVKRAVHLTGCSLEEMLAKCRLVPGDPERPEDWPVSGLWQFLANCPKNPAPAPRIKRGEDGKADFTECDESSDFAVKCEYDVRFALLVHWSCVASLREDKNPALTRVRHVLTSFRHERQLGEIHRADIERKRSGGAKRAKKLKAKAAKNSKPIVDEWRAYEKQGRSDRHLWAGRIADRLGVSRRSVDRYLKQAGCRK